MDTASSNEYSKWTGTTICLDLHHANDHQNHKNALKNLNDWRFFHLTIIIFIRKITEKSNYVINQFSLRKRKKISKPPNRYQIQSGDWLDEVKNKKNHINNKNNKPRNNIQIWRRHIRCLIQISPNYDFESSIEWLA